MLLIKLGGSIITNKEKPLSPRRRTIDRIIHSLKKVDESIVVVHGGGSYGHYWSVKYDMHTKPKKYDPRGVSIIKNSMVELNRIILDSFLKNKLNPYCLPPTDFVIGNKPTIKKIKQIEKIANAGLIPITYGDALWYGDKKYNPIGLEEKVKCHLPNGKLHRAFTALMFDKEGRLLVTRRSLSKMLWPGDWDGTVASHPREKETYVSSSERRMPEEIGISCKFDYLFKFEYHVPYKDVGSENEICATLLGIVEKSSQ